jgi:hypothetical protein
MAEAKQNKLNGSVSKKIYETHKFGRSVSVSTNPNEIPKA